MKTSIIVLIAVVSLSSALCARENTDIVVMKNGDRLTGQVKGLDAGVLYVSLPYVVQTLSVDWTTVVRIESSQLFLVRTQSGAVYRGMLEMSAKDDEPIHIEVLEAPEQPMSLAPREVVEISETSSNFWQRFNGQVNLGTTFSKANNNFQYTLGSAAEYLRERWSTSVAWNSNLSDSSGVDAATRNQVGGSYSHLLRKENTFYSGIFEFLQSSEQGIERQTSLGGGIVHHFKNTNKTKIAILGGFVWQNAHYDQAVSAVPTQNLGAGMIAGELKLFKFNKTNFNLTAVLFPVLTDAGRAKFNTNAAYYVKLPGNLSWNVSFYGNWDNRPPSTFSGSDYGTSSGLSWTFGMK